jgi:hypothetical protein
MRHFKLIIVTGLYFLDSITHTGPDDFTNAKVWAGVPDYRIYSHAHGEANAINKDRKSLIFDRRADIHLTIDT